MTITLTPVQARMVAGQVTKAVSLFCAAVEAKPNTKAHAVGKAAYDAHAEAMHALLHVVGGNVTAAPFGLWLDIRQVIDSVGPRPTPHTPRYKVWADETVSRLCAAWGIAAVIEAATVPAPAPPAPPATDQLDEVREVVLDALRRLQVDRIRDGVTEEHPSEGVAEFTDAELAAIVKAAK